MEETETFGRRLRRIRMERGASQRSIASPGVSHAYVSRLEAGTRTPTFKAVEMLAERLEVTPLELLFGELPPEVCPCCKRGL